MSYEMIWEERGVYRRFYGHTTDLEISQAVEKVESSERFDEVRYVINDFRDVTRLEIVSPTFIDETAAIDMTAARSNPNIKIAIITTTPEIIALAEEYANHKLTPYQTQIYQNLQTAREWVMVSPQLKSRAHKLL